MYLYISRQNLIMTQYCANNIAINIELKEVFLLKFRFTMKYICTYHYSLIKAWE